MKKQNYAGVAVSVYINYAIVGMATIIISQYSNYFQNLWNTDVKGISMVISAVGIGRLLTIIFAGIISDRIGRKKTMLIAMATDIIFLLGISFSHNVIAACIFALFFGATNTFGDTSGYPALTDAFKEKSATMNSLVKAFMSFAQFLFPFWVAMVPNAMISAVVLVVILVLNSILTFSVPFAPTPSGKIKKTSTTEKTVTDSDRKLPSMAIDGSILIVLGFTISFTFYVYSQYAPNFGTTVLNKSVTTGASLISWYALASMISVFITAILVTRIKHLTLIAVYSFLAAVGLAIMIMSPSLTTARLASVTTGFFGAGGVWQVGLSVLTDYFPHGTGKLTSYYSLMASLTYFVGPLISSFVLDGTASSVIEVFTINLVITVISVILVFILIYRNKKYQFDTVK